MEDHKNTNTEKESNQNQGNGGNISGITGLNNEGSRRGDLHAVAAKQGAGHGDAVEKTDDKAVTFMEIAKSTAGDAYDAVAEKASSAINDRKSDLSVGLVGVADTVRRVAGAFKDGDSKNSVTEYASTYSDTAAEKLEQAAEYIETSDLKRLSRDVQSFARRNPAIFLGAAFAAGVLAARFIKSSPPSDPLTAGAAKSRSGTAAKTDGSAFAATA